MQSNINHRISSKILSHLQKRFALFRLPDSQSAAGRPHSQCNTSGGSHRTAEIGPDFTSQGHIPVMNGCLDFHPNSHKMCPRVIGLHHDKMIPQPKRPSQGPVQVPAADPVGCHTKMGPGQSHLRTVPFEKLQSSPDMWRQNISQVTLTSMRVLKKGRLIAPSE